MNFKRLEKNDINLIKEYLKKTKTLHSPYSLSSIFLWDDCLYKAYWSWYKDFIIISENPVNNKKNRIMLPLPYNMITPKDLFDILKSTGYNQIFYVPDEYLEKNKEEIIKNFNIIHNQSYSDYIYLTNEISELKGSKYSPKRNLINQFEKNYTQNYEIKNINENLISDIIELTQKTWEQTDKEKFDMLECEKKAIFKVKEMWKEINFFGLCIYINKEIKAFAIGSELNSEMCICNFEKADKNIKGLYQLIDREFSKLASMKYKYINKESDLGKESLKKSKESYHPAFRVESYILELK